MSRSSTINHRRCAGGGEVPRRIVSKRRISDRRTHHPFESSDRIGKVPVFVTTFIFIGLTIGFVRGREEFLDLVLLLNKRGAAMDQGG